MSDRENFSADELAMVLSHYDLGVIEAIKDFPRGSRKAPKLLIRTEHGEYLLKRRAKGKDDPFKVAFCHALQFYLAQKQFPLPHLVGTRKENNSMLQTLGNVYELFEYISGSGYDSSPESTFDAGRILSLYHKLLRDYTPEYAPPTGSYHYNRQIGESLDQIPAVFNRSGHRIPSDKKQLSDMLNGLREAYLMAAQRVNTLGLPRWPLQIVHGDWHPGNMLFRNRQVVAVIDYDSARLQQRVIDLANGALQLSNLGGGDDPEKWPSHIDETRFAKFIRGYDTVDVISVAELQTIPWLMIEAMVAESVFHVAATGSFGHLNGYGFLRMIERKIAWVSANMEKLIKVASHE